jgi:hypothetical protein
MRAMRRNGGIREPEMSLPALIPYVVIMVVGDVIISVGGDQKWAWEAIVIEGHFFIGIQVCLLSLYSSASTSRPQLAAIPAIAMTYATDCYKPVTGQIFAAATIVKSLWGYGVSQFVDNWVAEAGYLTPSIVNMALMLLLNGVGAILLYIWGKDVRRWAKGDEVHRMHSGIVPATLAGRYIYKSYVYVS